MSITIERVGPSLEGLVENIIDDLEASVTSAFGEVEDRWYDVVRDSTWLSNRPSPRSKIVFDRKSETVAEYGWTDYKGGQAASQRRIDQRTPILEEQLEAIIFREIEKAFK